MHHTRIGIHAPCILYFRINNHVSNVQHYFHISYEFFLNYQKGLIILRTITVMPVYTHKGSPIAVKIMMFIDAGYFLHWLEKIGIKKEDYHFKSFSQHIAGKNGFPQLDTVYLVRTYYYDALADATKTQQFNDQRTFHGYLNYTFTNFEVKTGYLVDQGKMAQKGVDSMMAFDMVSKAQSNQYDIAILVGGDLDHLPAVKMVKEMGKEVYGVYYNESVSKELVREFDARCELKKDNSEYKHGKTFFENYKEYIKK